MRTLASNRRLDDKHGAIRVEDVYDTDIDDLWAACTVPERLGRWIAEVSGELREGGTVHTTYTSTASGSCRIEVCEPPRHLLLTHDPEDEAEGGQTEAWLTSEGEKTRLVVEERGLPADKLHFYCAGWQAHLEDLATTLVTGGAVHPDGWSDQRPAAGFHARFEELIPVYEKAEV